MDILSNALSDAHECPFDHVTTIKIFAIQNIASKQIFARWQAILSVFDFDIEFIEGTQNSIPDFLTHEFLQSLNHNVGEKDTASPTPQTP